MPEIKTGAYWYNRRYSFIGNAKCEGCGATVQLWRKRGIRTTTDIPIDGRTYEPHYANCPEVKRLRSEQQMKAGVI